MYRYMYVHVHVIMCYLYFLCVYLCLSVCLSVCLSQDAHDSEISALAFSPDGQYMATGGADKVVKVWTVRPAEGTVGWLCTDCFIPLPSLTEKVEPLATLHDSRASIMSIQFDQLVSANQTGCRIHHTLNTC